MLHTGSLPCHLCLALPSGSDIPYTPPLHILSRTQDMRTPLAVTLATNVIHLVLSLLFIFPGHWGVTGAAASTSIAEWLAAATYLALGWGRRQELGLDPWPQMDVRKAWKQYVPFLQVRGWRGSGDRVRGACCIQMRTRGPAPASTLALWASALGRFPRMPQCSIHSSCASLTLCPPPGCSVCYIFVPQAGGAVLMRTAVLLGTKTLASAVATRLGPASIASHQVLTQVRVRSHRPAARQVLRRWQALCMTSGHGCRPGGATNSTRLLHV